MSHGVDWTKTSRNDLKRLDPPQARAIVEAVEAFARAGHGDVKPLRGRAGEWRLRIGDWRVRFVPDVARQRITVIAVAHRREAYR